MKKAHVGSMFMALMAALVFSVTNRRGNRGGAERRAGQGALEALYNATGGANWTNNTNWLSDEPLERVARRLH